MADSLPRAKFVPMNLISPGTVPAGDLTTGVVYDYLRLELDEAAKFTASNG